MFNRGGVLFATLGEIVAIRLGLAYGQASGTQSSRLPQPKGVDRRSRTLVHLVDLIAFFSASSRLGGSSLSF